MKKYSEEEIGQTTDDEKEKMDYSVYNEIWSEGGMGHDSTALEGGAEFHIEIEQLVYDRYYSKWSEEEMLSEMEKRQPFLNNCSFYSDVIQYLEDTREVRAISAVVEPLYYTDLKYYTEEDFKGQLWYVPTCEAEAFSDTVFNKYEKANLEILLRLEKNQRE